MVYRTYHRIAAVAVMGAVVLTGAAQLAHAQEAPAKEKKVKDQGEYDIYNQTLKDLNNPAAGGPAERPGYLVAEVSGFGLERRTAVLLHQGIRQSGDQPAGEGAGNRQCS